FAAEAVVAPSAPVPAPAQPGSASPPQGATSPEEKPEAGGAHAIPRRHAPLEQLVRQGSFRGFPTLSQKNSPFKRQLSLRLNELPSTLQRKGHSEGAVLEVDAAPRRDSDGISALCTQIDASLAQPAGEPPAAVMPVEGGSTGPSSSWNDPPASPLFQPGHKRTPSEAERWLEEVAKAAKAQQQQQQQPPPLAAPAPLPGFPAPLPAGIFASPHMPPTFVPVGTAYAPAVPFPALPSVPVVGITPSQMVANAFCSATQAPIRNLGVKAGPFPQALLAPPRLKANGTVWPPEQSQPGVPAPHPEPPDPFEAQWAALESKAPAAASNPFSGDRQKTFEIEL
ncbi:numb-like protein, partial [Python bivittatus]|uniref:Numb-like protein n=1 Tax=Python bivittatus TaxID=176946 RepID=A0A9F2WJW4_PYTBI